MDSKILTLIYLCGFIFCIFLLAIALPSLDEIEVLAPSEISELSDLVAKHDGLNKLFHQAIAEDKKLRRRDWSYAYSVMTPIENEQHMRYAKSRFRGD